MIAPAQKRALSSFYENLAQVQSDHDYYLNPIGLSRCNAIIRLIQAQDGDTIVDLGCGDGLIAVKLRGNNRRMTGCDLSLTRVRRAITKGIEAVCADLLHLPYPEAMFDKAVCTEVIEHVPNPTAALKEINRVLRAGGIAVLTVPLDEDLNQTLLDVPETILASSCYYELQEQFHLENSHLSSFTVESFKKIVTECGFDIDAVDYTYDYTLEHPWILMIAKKIYSLIAIYRCVTPFSQFVKTIIWPLIYVSYHRQDTRHHIVVRARKLNF